MPGFGFGSPRATLRRRASAPPAPPAPPPASLAALTLSPATLAENSAAGTPVGALAGTTSGSTLALVGDAGGRFALSGTSVLAGLVATDYEAASSHSITVRETLAGASNSPRDTVLTIAVTNVFEAPSLANLSFSATSLTRGTPASGSITGASAGSTISATGLPAGVTINDAARTWAYDGNAAAASATLTLTETLADSPNSPRASSVTLSFAAAGGTSATRYSFFGTGMRWHTAGQSHATNTFFSVEWWSATPDYDITDPRCYAPTFFSPTDGETPLAAGASITIQGWSVLVGASWISCDGASDAGIVTMTNSVSGALLPRISTTLTKNTLYRFRMSFRVSATNVTIPRNTAQGTIGSFPNRVQGSTSSLFGTLTSGAALSNSGGITYTPAFMVGKGGDGRPALLVLGDSIGYGVTQSNLGPTFSARNEFGYIALALDDNTTTKRLGYFNGCVPGQSACNNSGTGWDHASSWSGKIAAYQSVFDAHGDWPFDRILSQHITNSCPYSLDGSSLRVGFGRYFDLLKANYAKPISQMAGLPAGSSTDGFQTLANQSAASGKNYPASTNGGMWAFNDDLASGWYVSNGYIEDALVGNWPLISYDTGANRDKTKIHPFSTTLAAAAASNATSISTTTAPDVGRILFCQLDNGSYSSNGVVATAVTGTGPFTVTLSGTPFTSPRTGPAGGRVQAAYTEGLHPSPLTHRDVLAQSVVDWKTAKGFV